MIYLRILTHSHKNTTMLLFIHAACGEVILPRYAMVSSYSYGLVNGSEATVVCVKGYELTRGREKITLRCLNRQWHSVLISDDGSEKLRPIWSALCYQSQRKWSIYNNI